MFDELENMSVPTTIHFLFFVNWEYNDQLKLHFTNLIPVNAPRGAISMSLPIAS